ncbi:hypothetical protein KIN20_004918 [Parelaphostrongylus tenuis]|uniref:Uncharacterized protein n=1 Tax=Parelaphostrongylus tenuis TaxID=148309 RepID=A0AAD5QER5_PARTN|nr:hypothetical protein KIN20_004918 [Parelaphostrongylus tenuis]
MYDEAIRRFETDDDARGSEHSSEKFKPEIAYILEVAYSQLTSRSEFINNSSKLFLYSTKMFEKNLRNRKQLGRQMNK